MNDEPIPGVLYGHGRDRYYVDSAGSPIDCDDRRGEEPLYGYDEDDVDDG